MTKVDLIDMIDKVDHYSLFIMHYSLINYPLPENLIAQTPPSRRGDSWLLHRVACGGFERVRFRALPDLLNPGDLLIGNDSRVLPARLQARKSTGGAVEVLLERFLSTRIARVQLRARGRLGVGHELDLAGHTCRIRARDGRFFELEAASDVDLPELFERCGEVPLPPYIRRAADKRDVGRYQCVYARHPGAVAAPTAGLHFSRALIERLTDRGVGWATLTLHVGAGTFLPVESSSPTLHAERFHLSDELVRRVTATQACGGRVVAVGTTVVRALESAAQSGALQAGEGETQLFIKPGFHFRVVDRLITNFHLPGSSLRLLVAAFAGAKTALAYYREAVARQMRFYSYGDAMLTDRCVSSD